jgi:hypothetical protein
MNKHEPDNIDIIDDEAWQIGRYETLHFELRKGAIVPEYKSSEGSIASDVDYLTRCVTAIINSKGRMFELIPVMDGTRYPTGKHQIRLSKAAQAFLKCLKMDLDRIVDRYPSIETYNRYFGIFYNAVTREKQFEYGCVPFALFAKEDWLNSSDWNKRSNGLLTRVVDHLNEIVDEIRQEGNSESFQDWKSRLVRQPNENECRLWSLVLACLDANHHINVLRIDLGYAQYYCDPDLSGEKAVTYRQVRQHRIALRRFLKRDLKRYIKNPQACKGMGFAVKMEFGLDKTYHFHVIVILNGDAMSQDVNVAQTICDFWKEVITRGKGGAYNCNKATYAECGIGSIRYHDEEKLRILKTIVVPYVTKPDYYVGMVKPERDRSFWTSHPPEKAQHSRGRKRGKQQWVEVRTPNSTRSGYGRSLDGA